MKAKIAWAIAMAHGWWRGTRFRWMKTELQPAAPLDSPPVLYRGLDAVELAQLLCCAAAAWFLPSAVIGASLFDGFQAFSFFMIILALSTACTMFMTATAVRRLRRGRPYNWLNRILISRLPWSSTEQVVRHRAGWNL